MNYILVSKDVDGEYYFRHWCRHVPGRNGENTPVFSEEHDDAYVFDTVERAKRMAGLINHKYPGVKVEVVELDDDVDTLRVDGYVPLEKTVDAMCSDDFRVRLWAEYEQANTRRANLKKKRDESVKESKLYIELMDEQIKAMHDYMLTILARCEALGIDLDEVEKEIRCDSDD